MAKEVTAKDVIYALEYLGDALVRKSISDGRYSWQLRSGKLKVSERVAHEIRQRPDVHIGQQAADEIITFRRAA